MREKLIRRLDEIGDMVRDSGRGTALMGLGSAGLGLDRLDDYSDLDFFVIAKDGQKAFFLQDLSWLEAIHAVVYSFMNTVDGYKLLFADGIFCEMAVFEAADLQNIPYSQARIVWQDADSALVIADSNRLPQRPKQPPSKEFLLGEALSNLYVGLSRFRRGEKLSAAHFIQGYAVEQVLALNAFIEEEVGQTADAFNSTRRIEQRFPQISAVLPDFIQGYDNSPQSALSILQFLDERFTINSEVKRAIISLAG